MLISNLENMSVTSAVDMSAGKPRLVTWTGDDSLLLFSGATAGAPEPSSSEALFPKFAENADRVLHAVDPKTDGRSNVDVGTQYTRDWVVDENGEQ